MLCRSMGICVTERTRMLYSEYLDELNLQYVCRSLYHGLGHIVDLWLETHKLKLGLLTCIPFFVATLRYSLLLFYSSLNRFPRLASGVNSFVRADLCNVNIFEPDSSSGCTAHNAEIMSVN